MFRTSNLLLFLLCLSKSIITDAQISGSILDATTGEPIFNARIDASDGSQVRTDYNGFFNLPSSTSPIRIVCSALNYHADSINVTSNLPVVIRLSPITQILENVIVSANRRQQEIQDVQVSMTLIPSKLIRDKGFLDLEEAVGQAPGVFTMEGQVSIRGGGGYAYGVGSRTQLLMDGIPLVSPDRGDVKWNTLPLQNIADIEVIKGASSVLYGSGALNGVIALRTKEPTTKLKTDVKIQSGVYDNPKRKSLRWWTRNPTFHMIDYSLGKGTERIGNSFSIHGARIEGYRSGEEETRARLNGHLFFKPFKDKNHKFGMNYGAHYEDVTSFILWESDSLAYSPQGGTNPVEANSSLTRQKSIRINIDPNYKFKTTNGGIHDLNTRYYLVTTGNESNIYNAAIAQLFYTDYRYSKFVRRRHRITIGASNSSSIVESYVFGSHFSINPSFYSQYEFENDKLDITGGFRFEYFRQDSEQPDSRFTFFKKNMTIPVYPIGRVGIHYQVARATHLRSSIGNGIRFPSVAERFAFTSNGGVIIFPNPQLKPEFGWTSEIGLSQFFQVSKWKGNVDIAVFLNQYSNMIEFTFGIYNPDSIALSTDPNELGYIYNWAGFQAKNAEKALIRGFEISSSSKGNIGKVELTSLIGYTYMNPESRNEDPVYLSTFSDSSNFLKYRFGHLLKFDLSLTYKAVSFGFSCRYNSYMRNIDALFEDGVFGVEILPGLKDYRINNQNGDFVVDTRVAVKIKAKYIISFIVNNLLNNEYSSRPALIQPPRNYSLSFVYELN
jgi:outer membrane receptor protein involved in Fe transport